jgi:hypothetical protein
MDMCTLKDSHPILHFKKILPICTHSEIHLRSKKHSSTEKLNAILLVVYKVEFGEEYPVIRKVQGSPSDKQYILFHVIKKNKINVSDLIYIKLTCLVKTINRGMHRKKWKRHDFMINLTIGSVSKGTILKLVFLL